MKKTFVAAGMVALLGSTAYAETIGASIARFDDNFLTVMRNGMVDHAAGLSGVDLQVEDATDDLAKQIDQVKNFVASGVDAIIVNIVDTSAGAAVSAVSFAPPSESLLELSKPKQFSSPLLTQWNTSLSRWLDASLGKRGH